MPYTADERKAIHRSDLLNRSAAARKVKAAQSRHASRFGAFEEDAPHCSVCGVAYLRGDHHR